MCRHRGQLAQPAKEKLREQKAWYEHLLDDAEREYKERERRLTAEWHRAEQAFKQNEATHLRQLAEARMERDQLLNYVDTLRAALMQEFAFHGTTGPGGGFPVKGG